jgi:SAM-dependent methyltransferase
MPDDFLLPREYDVVTCVECGFTYADTSAKQQVYDAFYKSHSKYEDLQTDSSGAYSDYDLLRIRETADDIAKSCPDKSAGIIDIGCANGGILKQLYDQGYTNLMGYEPSAKSVEIVKSYGINCMQGSLFEADKVLQGRKFDYIILSHVMEHICDLKGAFNLLSELLNDGGKLYVEVPDASRYADLYIVPYYYFDSEHINHFDEISLTNLGITNNFSKVYANHKMMIKQQHPALFVIFEKKLPKHNTLQLAVDAKISIEKYIRLSVSNTSMDAIAELVKSQEEIYVFGAGNFTLRLLANTDLSKCNIKAFLDNDKNKTSLNNANEPVEEGKEYKLLIGKQMRSPEVLKEHQATVVICSAWFSKEIEEQVKSINPNIRTVVIR